MNFTSNISEFLAGKGLPISESTFASVCNPKIAHCDCCNVYADTHTYTFVNLLRMRKADYKLCDKCVLQFELRSDALTDENLAK